MISVFACGDPSVGDALSRAWPDERVVRISLVGLTEPAAFRCVVDVAPEAVIVAPDWAGEESEQLRGCWWLARAADMVRAPLVLLSTAAVFDTRDRRARTEFDAPAPDSPLGRSARAAELLVERTTTRSVIARVGPLDVGGTTLRGLLAAPNGVAGAGSLMTTPVRAADIGPIVRQLAVSRRYGIWHISAEALSIADCARALGMAEPPLGDAPVPVPLDAKMMDLSGMPPPAAWLKPA